MTVGSVVGEAFSPKFLPLWIWGPAALYTYLRGKVRLAPHRALLNQSTIMAPYNVLVTLFSKVPRRAYLDPAILPELAILRENWETLRDEAVALHEAGAIQGRETYDDAGFNSFFRRGWKRFYLKWYGDPHPSAVELCPRTLALLERTPRIQAAAFVRLGPHSKLQRHSDPFAGSLRYHLGLRTPNSDDCRLILDGEPYSWRDGEDVLFDETYIHQVFNDTDEERIIFFCDVERPVHTPVMRAVNRFMSRVVMRAARSPNVPGEEVGAINRLFALVYPIRVGAKKFKEGNRRLYYGLKYGAVVLAVALWFAT